MVSWQLFTMIWIHSHAVTCWFLILLLPVLWTIFECACWVISLVAALAASRWTNWSLCSCWVSMSDTMDEAPIDRLDSDPLFPGWVFCVAMIWWCGRGEEDDHEKKWEVLRNLLSASCQNEINSSQLVHYTQDGFLLHMDPSCRSFRLSSDLHYVSPVWFVCSPGWIEVYDSWNLMIHRYK